MLKRLLLIVLCLTIGTASIGCSKKQTHAADNGSSAFNSSSSISSTDDVNLNGSTSSNSSTSSKDNVSSKEDDDVQKEYNKYKYPLVKGVNLSALEDKSKPSNFLNKENTYKEIAEKGFDHIRLPVDFRNYADKNGVLQESFLNRLDNIINMATENGLAVMLDFHGWYDFNVSKGDDKLFLNIWENLAKHYKDYPDTLLFELINEPHTTEGGDLDMPTLLDLQTKAIEKIRKHSPDRTVVVATAEWNGSWTLKDFRMPGIDNIIIAVHTYAPMDFTHQGQVWADRGDVKMDLNYEVIRDLKNDLNHITEFVKTSDVPVILNEFGLATNGYIPAEDVEEYVSIITAYAKSLDIPWTYWAYTGSFGLYNEGFLGFGKGWRENVVDALFKPYNK